MEARHQINLCYFFLHPFLETQCLFLATVKLVPSEKWPHPVLLQESGGRQSKLQSDHTINAIVSFHGIYHFKHIILLFSQFSNSMTKVLPSSSCSNQLNVQESSSVSCLITILIKTFISPNQLFSRTFNIKVNHQEIILFIKFKKS